MKRDNNVTANDKQELIDIFEFITGKLLEQGERSVDEKAIVCLLRSKKGLRCAIGWMIPDSVYESMSKKQWKTLERMQEPVKGLAALGLYEECFGRKFPQKTELLNELQFAHDHEEVDMWAHAFKRIKDLYL